MKWKMTSRFLITVLSIIMIVVFVNMVILIAFVAINSKNTSNTTVGETFVRDFSNYLFIEDDGLPSISTEGIKKLKEKNAWVQLLDENGNVVTSAETQTLEMPTHYSPVELIQVYKYREYDGDTTTFIAPYDQYSYLMGIKNPSMDRLSLTVDTDFIVSSILKYIIYILLADLIIALVVGLLFGSILTKPLYKMIEQIHHLRNQNYQLPKVKRAGIYKNVFANLKDVAGSLEKQEQERKQLEKMRNDWISNVTHDMKTPLSSIQGYAELLTEENLSESDRFNYAEVIERQSKYMAELLDDFNLTMRLRNDELPLNLEVTSIDKFTREMVIDLLNDAQYAAYNIEYNADENVAQVKIDRHLMKRAILNFLVNAFVHNDAHTNVSIHVSSNSTSVSIEITDNGKGIAEEDLPQIFDRYYRGTNTESIKGTGLGMAISRDIITAHQGEVTIQSRLGEGTKIMIELPIAN